METTKFMPCFLLVSTFRKLTIPGLFHRQKIYVHFKHVFSPPRNSKVHLEFHTGFLKLKRAVSQNFLVGEIMMFLDFRNL